MKIIFLFFISIDCFALDSYTLDQVHRNLESEVSKLPGRISIINSKMLMPANMKSKFDLNRSSEIQSAITGLKDVSLKYMPKADKALDHIKIESIYIKDTLKNHLNNNEELKDLIKSNSKDISDSIKKMISD